MNKWDELTQWFDETFGINTYKVIGDRVYQRCGDWINRYRKWQYIIGPTMPTTKDKILMGDLFWNIKTSKTYIRGPQRKWYEL